MRWPWKRSRKAVVLGFNLKYARGTKIKRGRWKIEIGEENGHPFSYDFWGTDEQARAEIEKEHQRVAAVRRGSDRALRAYKAMRRVHTEGRHTGSSVEDCPRCRSMLRRLGGEL